VFVRNLPFDWADLQLAEAFQSVGPVRRAFVITTRKQSHHMPGETQQSRGFGFVEFALASDALRAVATLNNHVIPQTSKALKVEVALDKKNAQITKENIKKQSKEQQKALKQPNPAPAQSKNQNLSKVIKEESESSDSETSEDEKAPAVVKTEPSTRLKSEISSSSSESSSDSEVEIKAAEIKVKKEAASDAADSQEEEEEEENVYRSDSKESEGSSEEEEIPVKNEETNVKKEGKEAAAPSAAHPSRTLLLSGIPVQINSLQKELKANSFALDAVETIIFPSPESTNKYKAARIVFATEAAALEALQKLNQIQIMQNKLRAFPLSEKSARLIIRNLPFHILEKHIVKLIRPVVANLVSCAIPMETQHKAKGFAFVQCNSNEECLKIIEKFNGISFMGRPIAVDWALNKSDYEKRIDVAKKIEQKHIQKAETKLQSAVKEENKEENTEINQDNGENSEEEGEEGSKSLSTAEAKAEIAALDASDAKSLPKTSDTARGCTIFIRNLSYDTSEEQLTEKFSQYGRVKYSKIVIDPVTKQSRGTGFVLFESADTAQRVAAGNGLNNNQADTSAESSKRQLKRQRMKRFTAENGIELNGRVLNIAIAVDRAAAGRLAQQNEAERKLKDSRNLYLAREGVILKDSEAAQGLSQQELDRRTEAYKTKKKKLENPNYAVSSTRLSVRNLPAEVDEKQLKSVFLAASAEEFQHKNHAGELVNQIHGRAVIKQVKLMRESDKLDPKSGLGRSKRFGFVEFTDHQHALHALRVLNNNPKAFLSQSSSNNRPVIEFSIEDVRKLQLRKKKLEFQQKKLTKQTEAKPKGSEEAENSRETDEIPTESAKKQQKRAAREAGVCYKCGSKSHKAAKCKKRAEASVETAENGSEEKKSAKSTDAEVKSKGKTLKSDANNKRKLPESSSSRSSAEKTVEAGGAVAAEKAPKKQRKSEEEKLSKRERADLAEEAKFDQMVASYKRKYFDPMNSDIKETLNNIGSTPLIPGHSDKKRWFES
jgi:nucleolar protein 4